MSSSDRKEERQNIAELQENFNKQQAKISALKELVRKSEEAHGKSTSSTQEKVKNIAQRLTHLKSKARSRKHLDRSFSEFRDDTILEESSHVSGSPLHSTPPVKARSETPGTDKIQLLRQQMEKNKLKMAERENSKREIEELVTQLKARIDSTQQSLERSSELGRSMGDLTCLTTTNTVSSKFKSATDLSFTPINLDKEKIKFLENRVKILEKQLEKEKNTPKVESEIVKTLESQILDLEENLKEKECIIQARTQAVSLMTESLSAKGKSTVDMLEDTKQEMFKMQSSFVETEDALKDEIQQIKLVLEEKESKIINLEEVNDILETARFDLTVKNSQLESKIQNVQDYSTKISELNKLNETLQHRIADLEGQISDNTSSQDVDVAKQVGEEYANTIKNLQEKINTLEKENDELKKFAQEAQDAQDTSILDSDIAVKIKSLDSTIEAQREEIANHINTIQQLEDQLAEKTIEYNVLNANFSVLQEKLKASAPRSLFSTSSYEEAEVEINKLKTQLDEANKAMIKMKLKAKQLQKQVDSFNKMSDVHAALIKVTGENEQLQQKILELEEEKGQLQLNLVTGESTGANDAELEKKLQILETTCQNQTSAIQLLEEQKLDMTENLQSTKQQLESLKYQMNDQEETALVVSQIETIQLEEKVNTYVTEMNQFKNELERYKNENEKLNETVQKLQQDKDELGKKVDHYIAENIELLDKIEKLSKSSSSAESIEIVERLTHQEKLEIEEFNKRLEEEHQQDHVDDHAEISAPQITGESGTVMGEELSESLTKLREESSELMHRIELFTTERREVLEKMEHLNNENEEHINRINELVNEKHMIEANLSTITKEKQSLEDKYKTLEEEKIELLEQIAESNKHRELLTEEMNIRQKERNSVNEILQAASVESNLLDDYEKSLSRLTAEVENFSKASDRGNKINSSKKLAKEAKNVCQQMTGLFKKIKASSTHKSEDEATRKVTQKGAELEKIIETLQKDYKEALSASNKKDEEISALTSQLDALRKISEEMDKSVNEKEASYDDQISHLKQIRKDVEAKLQAANNEIDILKTLVTEQKQQLIESYTEQEAEVNAKVERIEQYEQEIENLKRELEAVQSNKSQSYEKYVEELKAEIRKLELLLNENKLLATQQTQELINKQETVDSLNTQIVQLYKTIEDGINKIAEKEEEVVFMQELLDSNRSEMDKLIKENEENKKVIEKLLMELHSQTEKIAQVESFKSIQEQNRQFEARIKELEKLNSDYELRCKEQHDKLKKFAANLKKKVAQCSELENKIRELNETATNMDIKSTNTKALEYQDRIMEIENLKEKLERANTQIKVLLQDKDVLKNELDKKHTDLEHTKHLSGIYLTKIEETSLQLGELQALVEISRSEFDEKLRREQDLQRQIDLMQREHEDKVKTLSDDLNTKNVKFEKSKAVIKEKIREIQRLSQEKEELVQKLNSSSIKKNEEGSSEIVQEENIKLKDDYSKLSETYQKEKITFQETISRLETLHDGIQAKLQEDMAYIESLELENNKFKEKIFKLEECVACFEERRSSLEQYANLLDAQLQQKADEYEKNEDVLVYRLNTLSKHDDIIGRKLLETQEEKEELTDKLERSKHEYTDLMKKFTKLEQKFESFHTDKFQNLEYENQALRDQVAALQTEIDKLQTTFEVKLSSKTAEIDELENDLSIQLQNVNTEKRSLQENLEKSRDDVQSLKDENVKLKENCNSLEQTKNDLEREITWIRMQNENLSQDQFELQELRMQVIQDKTEIDNQKHQLETIVQNHEIELNVLRTQIAELDSMRMQVSKNQTDDQVFIETENKRLKELLAEKEAIIDNYQRQNLQLQMSALSVPTADPFATITEGTSVVLSMSGTENVEISALQDKCKAYEAEISDLNKRIAEKDEKNNKITSEMTNLQQRIQHITLERQREISQLKSEIDRLRVPRNDITSPFMFEPPSSNVFEELATIREVQTLELGVHDQKKIEDLQRNVSDLEKYAAELENKLKHLTHVHEDTLKLLKQKTQTLDELEKNSSIRIQNLEVKEKQLNTQQNIEKIWGENKDTNAAPYLSMFFDNVPVESDQTSQFLNEPESNIPVEEELIVPEKAYICHPKVELDLLKQQNEAGDDWGWGSEEAALDEKHYHSTIGQQFSLLSTERNMEIKLQECQDRINELELERNRLEEQKVELQVKSGKMMKKLKEYKNTIAQLSNSQASFRKSSSVESNDLDLAIQEELNSQISKLEEKLAEMRKQSDKDAIEKENFLKKIDVLTVANERMIEMKERQDIQVETYQTQVRQLSQQLKTLEDWSENANQAHEVQLKTYTQVDSGVAANQENWEKKYLDTSHELEDLKVDRDELQALLDEEKQNHKLSESKIQALQGKVNTLEADLKEHSHKNDLRTSLDAEHQTLRNEFNEMKLRNQELQLLLSDYQSTIEQLSSESNSIKANLDILRDEHRRKLDENSKLTSELQSWIERNNDRSKEIEAMQLAANDPSKVSENHIQCERKIAELKENLSFLEAEILTKEYQISGLLEEKKQWREMREKFDQENLDQVEIVKQLRTKVDDLETEKGEFQEKIKMLERTLDELKSEKEHMEKELQVLNNHVIVSLENEDKMKQTVLELDMKNIEIVELKKSLEIFKAQQIAEPQTKDNLNQEQLEELNVQWEAIVEQRCGEVAESWRIHLTEKENEFKRIEASLKEEIEELKTQKPASIDIRTNSEESGEGHIQIFKKMQAALESQELEIVTLKEQLATRSAEYARLAAQHDPYAEKTTSSHSDHSSLVQKSELDLALYMLHQRDMRCEELTLELVNLLEERDTLQLKLSNTLRQIEEIKRKTGYFESGSESDHGGVSNPDSPEKSKLRATNLTSEEELLKENEDLNSKLSQLHVVSHPKDKRLLEERNQSQRGMDKIQEDVANMPPEAVSELVGKDLSNTNQSPSTVLLNWLWGKTNSPQEN